MCISWTITCLVVDSILLLYCLFNDFFIVIKGRQLVNIVENIDTKHITTEIWKVIIEKRHSEDKI